MLAAAFTPSKTFWMAAVSSALPSPRAPCFFTSIQSERGSQFSAGRSFAALAAGGAARQSATAKAMVAVRGGMITLLVNADGSRGKVGRGGAVGQRLVVGGDGRGGRTGHSTLPCGS